MYITKMFTFFKNSKRVEKRTPNSCNVILVRTKVIWDEMLTRNHLSSVRPKYLVYLLRLYYQFVIDVTIKVINNTVV